MFLGSNKNFSKDGGSKIKKQLHVGGYKTLQPNKTQRSKVSFGWSIIQRRLLFIRASITDVTQDCQQPPHPTPLHPSNQLRHSFLKSCCQWGTKVSLFLETTHLYIKAQVFTGHQENLQGNDVLKQHEREWQLMGGRSVGLIYNITMKQSRVEARLLAAFLHSCFSPNLHTSPTFVPLQHVLVRPGELLLLGVVGRQQTRHEPGHAGSGLKVRPAVETPVHAHPVRSPAPFPLRCPNQAAAGAALLLQH